MELGLDNVIDRFLHSVESIYPNHLKFNLDKFISENNIDFINFIDEIEKLDLDIEKYFLEKVNQRREYKPDDEQKFISKLFLNFIDYCYYLNIQKDRNNKGFVMPSNDSFEYKMNNDIRPSKNKTYVADMIMSF